LHERIFEAGVFQDELHIVALTERFTTRRLSLTSQFNTKI